MERCQGKCQHGSGADHLAQVLRRGVILRIKPKLFVRLGRDIPAREVLLRPADSQQQPAALAWIFLRPLGRCDRALLQEAARICQSKPDGGFWLDRHSRSDVAGRGARRTDLRGGRRHEFTISENVAREFRNKSLLAIQKDPGDEVIEPV